MRRFLISLFFIVIKLHISNAQVSFTTSSVISTCSANGSITVTISGGASPYYYQIISSSNGIVRPVQTVNVFNNLPSGSYTIRVTDNNNLTVTNTAVIGGNYIPLSFTHTQQQSTITITALNGKKPYSYTYSTDGGATFLPPSDSNIYRCMKAGPYLFRIYDSCSNFYTENVVVFPINIVASFSCVPDIPNNSKAIVLNSIVNGNGGYSYHAFGVNYNQTNATGNFTNINRCNKNISVQVTDQCNEKSVKYVVCPTPEYTFDVTCVNFKDHEVTIGNVNSGSGLPYLYIGNDVASSSTTVKNFPIPGDSILAGLMDSCGFKNTVKVDRMKIFRADSSSCKSGNIILSSSYNINGKPVSFPPTRYISLSGPSSFNVIDTTRDSSIVEVDGLLTGQYKYKIVNACGDETLDSFYFIKRCFNELTVNKFQTCNSLRFNIVKDCLIDTTALYTLQYMNGTLVQQNRTGVFLNLSNDTCYKMLAHDVVCDTTILDYIYPIRPRLHLFQNACNELSFAVSFDRKQFCGTSLGTAIYKINAFVITDSLYNVLLTNTSGIVNPVPPKAYWVFAQTDDCNTDTLRYTNKAGFKDTMRFCITPTVRFVNIHKCNLTWNISILNNLNGTNFNLVGNGVNVTGLYQFNGIDSGRYILKDGCNEQELVLPSYYNFTSVINPGCPSNASITAGNFVDTGYINSMGRKYFFTVCNAPPLDYNIWEVGSGSMTAYNTNGYFSSLKTGTFYNIIYKGNQDCNFYSDTIFTPFYKRPALTATYGLICNGNNATVRASVTGGTPPYTYEVLNTSIPKIVTDSTYVIYTGLPLGSALFRVYDHCGISTDYSTEVLSVNFQPTYKKKCNGDVQLVAPDIFNTTYVWTNRKRDTIGTTPIVYTKPNGNDSFTVTINHLTCSISKSLLVSDFAASINSANAGIDFYADTTLAFLQGNIPNAGAVGTWRQIDPSSGNSVFADVHDPKTKVDVDVFPGQYTYVWTITDTVIGCITEDTVVVSYLRCPNIKPVEFTKTVKQANCAANGEININITQSSTRIHFLWNTGDTTPVIKNLKDSMYIVTISDETSCTADIRDTTFITQTNSTSSSLIATICDGDSIIINNRKYKTGGTFTDSLKNSNGCDSILSIDITVVQKSERYDTVILCSGEKYMLQNGQSIIATGDYPVKLKNSNGCDSTIFSHIVFNRVDINNIDTIICSGLSYKLPRGTLVSMAGIYSDTLQNIYGCDSIIKTDLAIRDSLTMENLGPDTVICNNDHLLLSLSFPPQTNYLWQDSSTLSEFNILKEGIYYVKVYGMCNSVSDTIHITTKDCSCNFYLPDAFSPNNDNINDVFKPFNKCLFYKEYSFTVFNRWGQLVFHTIDENEGWNGADHMSAQFTDNYIWTLEYFDVLRKEKMFFKGTVVLLK